MFEIVSVIATLGSNLDSESKLCSEEPEWVIKSLLTTHPPPTTRNFYTSSRHGMRLRFEI